MPFIVAKADLNIRRPIYICIYMYIYIYGPRMTTNHPSSYDNKGWSLSRLVMREKKRKEEKKKKEKMGIDWLNRLPFNLSNLDLTPVDTLGQVNLFGEGRGHTWVLFERWKAMLVSLIGNGKLFRSGNQGLEIIGGRTGEILRRIIRLPIPIFRNITET